MTGVEDGKGEGGGGGDLSATDNAVQHQNGTVEKAPVVAGTNMETLPRPGKQSDPSTAFLRAARAGQLEKVLEFLQSGVDINASNTNGLNALHLAAKDGHLEIVRELLTRGATVDAATKKGNTALHIASLAGQEEVVQLLVQRGASVNAQSQNGFTPLYMAAQENHDSVVKFLLSKGANQTLATEDGFTPLAVAMQQGHDKVVAVLLESDTRGKVRLPALHIAAKKDDCKAAALLLQNDHNPDVTSKSGFTPLHIAAHYGNDRIASLLYDKGADVNFAAKHNITPIHVAAKWGKIKMVNLLMSKGANISAKTRDGLTPLHCAARAGHHEVVDILIEKGAPIGLKTKNGLAPLHMASQGDHVDAARILLYHRAPVDEVTVDYLTALHVAAHCGHVRVAKLLLDRNADPNARALNGFTPLHIACKKNRIKIVELLLKHKASIETTTESGLTPLHVASFMGCMNIVIYLLQNEASPDIPTVRGETPLHLAARANQTDIIRILLRNGAQVDARAREEQTPLHVASRLGNVDIVMLLLQHGADVDATTKDLYTPLHIAAKEGQEEVASVLLENGASLTATTKKGFTPLHLAAKYGNMNVARLLLQKNAPVDAQGKNGVTPLHVASHYDHQNVALLLLDKGASPHAMAKNGHTPLHIAARKNQMDIATTLLEYGAKANAESKAGFTPLHLSAQEGHTDMSTLLIEHKADTNHKAKNGLTPLHLCAQEDKTNVATILVKNGAQVDATTKAGYTPLHVAAHFGQAAMVRFLLRAGAAVDSSTGAGYTSLHQAAQQGHTLVINLLLESKAKPNAVTNNGQTALAIAQKLGYISVVETLKVVTETIITTTQTITIEEKYKVQAPESMQETFMSDSEDEGGGDEIGIAAMNVYGQPPHAQHVYLPSYYQGQMTYTREDPMLSDQQQYRYMTVDDMKSMGDDSMRVNVTDDERDNRHSGGAIVTDTMIKDNYQRSNAANIKPDNVDIQRHPVHVGFLVSFLVDARGGAMRGCRHSGVRVIVPPRKAAMPMRVTCRYLKRDKLTNPPPLMEGEALASRILELGPVGAKFLGPVIIEVPHFASLRGKEREIVILRSDNGETWREHTLEASEEAVQDVLNESFEGEELSQLEDLQTSRIVRVLTVDFPHYFAVVSRIRQEVHAVGPEGGTVSSSAVPQVQAVFPQAALTKKIRVGLQAHPIPAELVAKLLGNRVAVSPIVTVEPRRRKFHKPITLTIPVPQAANKGMINQYSGDAPTLRLLCSITGGQSRAVWEDVTGSTPLTFVKDCVSFTTTVSARFWLMDCRNITEATRMATELYTHATHVPFMAKFVVFAKRVDPLEARLRVFCMTDDKEDKTLEHQEHFTEVAKSRDVEVLEGKTQYMEFAGNLVPVMKSGEQLQLPFRAFKENRVPFTARIKDPDAADMVGRIMFMSEPKVAKGEQPQTPICTLNILLPEKISPETGHSELDLLELSKNYSFLRDGGISRPDTIHRATIRLTDIANLLDRDWEKLAEELNISPVDVDKIKSEHSDKPALQAATMFKLWQSNGNKATGNTLEKALNKIGREDIVKKCIFNVELVTDDVEKAVARVRLDQPGFDSLKEELGPSRDSSLRRDGSLAHQKHDFNYDEPDHMRDSESIQNLNNVGNVPHKRTKQQHITITNGTVFNGTSTPIKDKYACEEKDIGDDMAEFLEHKCHVTDTMVKRTRDDADDDNKNRQRVIEDANRLVSGVIQDAEKEKEILAMEGLSGVYRDAGKEAGGAVGHRDNESLIQSLESTMIRNVIDRGEESIEPLIKKERRVIDKSGGEKVISKTTVTTTDNYTNPDSATIITKTTTIKEILTPGQTHFFGVHDPVIGSETAQVQSSPDKDIGDITVTKKIISSSGPIFEEKVTTSKLIVDKPEMPTVAFGINVPTDRAQVEAKCITRVAVDPVSMLADNKNTSEKEKLSKEIKEVADKTSKPIDIKSKSKGKVEEVKMDVGHSTLGKETKKTEDESRKSAYDGVYNIPSDQAKDDGKKKGGIFSGIFKSPKIKKEKSKELKESSFDSGDEEVKATTREFLNDTRKIANQSMPAISPTYPEYDSTNIICLSPAKLPEQEPHRDPIWATADFLYDSRRSAEAFIPETRESIVKPINGQSELTKTDVVISTDKNFESQDPSEETGEHKEKPSFFSNLFKGAKKAEGDIDAATHDTNKAVDTMNKKILKNVEDVQEKSVNGGKDYVESLKNTVEIKTKKLDDSTDKATDEVDSVILKSTKIVDDTKKSIHDQGKIADENLKHVSGEIKLQNDKIKHTTEKTIKLTTTESVDSKPEASSVKTNIDETTDEANEKSRGFFGMFKSPKSKDKRRSISKDKDVSKDFSFDSGDEELKIATAAFLDDTKRASDRMTQPDISKSPPPTQSEVKVEKFISSITTEFDMPKDKLKGTSYNVNELTSKDDNATKTIKTTTITTIQLTDSSKDSSQGPPVHDLKPEVRVDVKASEKLEKKEKRKSSDFEDSSDESKQKNNGFFGMFKSPKLKSKKKSQSRDRSTSKEPSFDSGDEELRQTTSKFLEDTRKIAETIESYDTPGTQSVKDSVENGEKISAPIQKEHKDVPVSDQEKGGLFGIFKSPKSNIRSRSKSKEKSPSTEKSIDSGDEELRIATAKFLEDTKNITAIREEYPYPSAPLMPDNEKVIKDKDNKSKEKEGEDDKTGKTNEKTGFLSGLFKGAKHVVEEATDDVKEFWDETKEQAKNEENAKHIVEKTAKDAKDLENKVTNDIEKTKDKVVEITSESIDKTVDTGRMIKNKAGDCGKQIHDDTTQAIEALDDKAQKMSKDVCKDVKDFCVETKEEAKKIEEKADHVSAKIARTTGDIKDQVVGDVDKAVTASTNLVKKVGDDVKKVKDDTDKEIQKDTKLVKEKVIHAVDITVDTAEDMKNKADKEMKKTKDKGKGFFSGIFKGKHATDEAAEEVKTLVDDVKKEADREKDDVKRTVADVNDDVNKGVKVIQENIAEKFIDGKNKVHHDLVTTGEAVTETVRTTSETISDAATDTFKNTESNIRKIDQELKDDAKLINEKVTGTSEAVMSTAESAKDKAEKEKKKIKEKGKGFFSGLFKGVKNAADEVVEDVKDFVDETKQEALEEEKQSKLAVEEATHAVKDINDKVGSDIKAKVESLTDDAEKIADKTQKQLDVGKGIVKSTEVTISDITAKTTTAAKDISAQIGEDVGAIKDTVDKELKKDTKLITSSLTGATESVVSKAEDIEIKAKQQKLVLKNEISDAATKIADDVGTAAEVVDEKTRNIIQDINDTTKATVKDLNDDKEKGLKVVQEKLSDGAKTVADAAETTKNIVEKETKKSKEAGKGFFSGLFKGAKHAADEAADDVKDFVDNTKKEALEEEERAKRIAAEGAQSVKDAKNKVAVSMKAGVEVLKDDVTKAKDKVEEKLVAGKNAVSDAVKSTDAAITDTTAKTSHAVKDTVKKVNDHVGVAKDAVTSELKEDMQIVKDKLTGVADSVVDSVETGKGVAEHQAENLKDKLCDTKEKIIDDVSKTVQALDKKSVEIANNVDETKKGAVKEIKDDVKNIEEKISDASKAIVDSAESTKHKIEKDGKKAKEKGKSFFSGIFKGSKHSVENTFDDVKDFLEEVKRESSDEKALAAREGEEKLYGKEDDIDDDKVTGDAMPVDRDTAKHVKLTKDDIPKSIESETTSDEVSKDATEKEMKKGKARASGFFSGIFKGGKQTTDDLIDDFKDGAGEIKKETEKKIIKDIPDYIEKGNNEVQSMMINGKEVTKSVGAAISNVPVKAVEIEKEIVKKVDENIGQAASAIDKQMEKNIKLVEQKSTDAKKSVLDNAALIEEKLKEEGKNLKTKTHNAEENIVEGAKNIAEAVDNKTREIAKNIDENKKAAEKGVKEDVKFVKDKLSDGTKVIIDSTDDLKHKTEKEVKKVKEKGKGFFSGIFKGGKQTSDEIIDDVNDFLNDTRKEAMAEGDHAQRLATEATETIKNADDQIAADVKARINRVGEDITGDIEKVVDNVDKVKDMAHDKIISVKQTIPDSIDTTVKTITDVTETTKQKIIDSAVSTSDAVKNTATAVTVRVEQTKDAAQKKLTEDAKFLDEKLSAAAETTAESSMAVKTKADKQAKKVKEKSKGFFSGILKGVKHTADEVVEDVRDFVDDTKKEALQEEDRSKHAAEEAAKAMKDTKNKIATDIKESTEKIVDDTTKVKDQFHEKLTAVKDTVTDTVQSTGATISDVTMKTSQAAKDTGKKIAEDLNNTESKVEKSIKENTKLVTDKLNDVGESIVENTEAAKIKVEQKSSALKDNVHDAAKKMAEDTSKVAKNVEEKVHEIGENFEKTKSKVSQEVKEDVEHNKKKINDGAQIMADSAENAIYKAEKEAKKAKEKGKGLFSGIFKGVKHTSDKVADDVKDFVDHTKAEALEEEERAKRTTEEIAQAAKDSKDKLVNEITVGVDKIATAGEKTKDKAQEKLMVSKAAATDIAKSTVAVISDTATETTQAARNIENKIDASTTAVKDTLDKEIKEQTKSIANALDGATQSAADSIEIAKNKTGKQAEDLKNKALNVREKVDGEVSKTANEMDMKANTIVRDVHETKHAIIKVLKDDAEAIKKKMRDGVEIIDDSVESAKHKVDKEIKKSKEKGKGLFSGIFKGVKHTADKVTNDVEDIVDDKKVEVEEEEARRIANDTANFLMDAKGTASSDIVTARSEVNNKVPDAQAAGKIAIIDTPKLIEEHLPGSPEQKNVSMDKMVEGAEKKIKTDAKVEKKSVPHEAHAVADSVDSTLQNVGQDVKKREESSSGFLSGIIKGAKNAVNEITDDVKEFWDETKEEAKEDEEYTRQIAEESEKNLKDKTKLKNIPTASKKIDKIISDTTEKKIVIKEDAFKDLKSDEEQFLKDSKLSVETDILKRSEDIEKLNDKAEKEARKAKDKSSGTFFGILKGAKQAADETTKHVEDFLDEARHEASEEKARFQKSAEGLAKSVKDDIHSGNVQEIPKISTVIKDKPDETKLSQLNVSEHAEVGAAVEPGDKKIAGKTEKVIKVTKDIEQPKATIIEKSTKDAKTVTYSIEDNKQKADKDGKKTKEKSSGFLTGIIKGAKHAVEEVSEDVKEFWDETKEQAKEEEERVKCAAGETEEKIVKGTETTIQTIKHVGEEFGDDVKKMEDSTGDVIVESVETIKNKAVKEVKQGKDKTSGMFFGILKGAKHTSEEVAGEVRELSSDTKHEAKKLKDGTQKAVEHIAESAQLVKDEAVADAKTIEKETKEKLSETMKKGKGQLVSEKEAIIDTLKETSAKNIERAGTVTTNSAETVEKMVKKTKQDSQDCATEIEKDIKKAKEKSGGFFSGIIKSAKHAVDEVSEEVKEFWDETKHEAKEDEERARQDAKEIANSLKSDQVHPDFVEDEEVIRQQMTADLERTVQHSADSPIFYTEIPLKSSSPSHIEGINIPEGSLKLSEVDSSRDRPECKITSDKSKLSQEKPKGVISSIAKGAKSASHKIAKEVDHATETIKDATEKFWEETKSESTGFKASGSYDVSSPISDSDSLSTHKQESDVKLESFDYPDKLAREKSPKDSESRIKSMSRIPQKISPTKELREVKVVRIEGVSRHGDDDVLNKLGHLEPRASQSVTTVITKSVRTATAIPPPSPDEFGDISIKDVTEEATKRAQSLADQALAAGKPESDFLQHSEPSYIETTTTEYDPVTNERITRTTRTMTSLESTIGETGENDELRDSMRKIVDQFMTEERRTQ